MMFVQTVVVPMLDDALDELVAGVLVPLTLSPAVTDTQLPHMTLLPPLGQALTLSLSVHVPDSLPTQARPLQLGSTAPT